MGPKKNTISKLEQVVFFFPVNFPAVRSFILVSLVVSRVAFAQADGLPKGVKGLK